MTEHGWEIDRRGTEMRTIWKVAPGYRARYWKDCQDRGCITINWLNQINCNKFKAPDDLRKALIKAKEGKAGAAHSIWQFVHDIQEEDIVVANDGFDHVVGIGVIKSGYLPPDHPRNPNKHQEHNRHARMVDWRIDKRLDRKNLFVGLIPTVVRLAPNKCDKIKQGYLKKYPELTQELAELFAGASATDDVRNSATKNSRKLAAQQLAEDLITIATQKEIAPTTKEALVNARVGQGVFREQVLQLWGQCCAITQSVTLEAIRASHIKPWRRSTDEERLDPYNGIPLIASLDALFDAGLISFDPSGRLIVSRRLNAAERHIFDIAQASLTMKPTAKTAEYLAFHRDNHFKK